MSHARAAIWIDPARLGGWPCLMGTRLHLSHTVGHLAAGHSLADYRLCYGVQHLSDRDIYAAVAWWVLNDKSRLKRDRQIRKQWHSWAVQTWDLCWHSDYTPEPPPALEDE